MNKKKGLLIYNQVDYEKNKWFANELITKASDFGLDLRLVLREHLVLTIENGIFTARYAEPSPTSEPSPIPEPSLTDLDFVINRTRDSLVGRHFEQMGCEVFNNATVTEICNHKGKTHQLINGAGIASVGTLIGNKHYFNATMLPFAYPVILKTVNGHGGDEVYMLHDEVELNAALKALATDDFVLQELCSNPGIDVRVFVLGKQILGAVKRVSTTNFKSNYSLGGSAHAYTLQPEEEILVNSILNLLDFDLAGIDFILDDRGRFLFNEIEDVVGTRTLYLNYDLDVVALFLNHISKKL